jgi:hypothetical protein
MVPTTQCVKVASLRKRYFATNDLSKWMNDAVNLYVGRSGRIFIQGEIFHYAGSKWANPYKLKDHSLEESLRLYRIFVETNLVFDLGELEGKTLGCFCDQSPPECNCHAKVLVELYIKHLG